MASTSKLPAVNGDNEASSSRAVIDLPLTDALPYFDDELETKPGLASRVQKEVQAEMAKMGSSSSSSNDSRLPPPHLSSSSRWDEELARIGARGEATKAIDVTRFQLAAPAGGAEEADDEEWQKAVDNAAAQLMHQETRLTNIELLKKFGGECQSFDPQPGSPSPS